jgi:hypothetical protein
VKDLPAQDLGSRLAPFTVQAQQLEPTHEVSAESDTEEPVAIGLEAGEGETVEPGLLQALDVTLDVGVGAHRDVEVHWVTLNVAVEAPVAKLVAGEETALSPGVQGLSSHNQPGSLGHRREIHVVGQFTDAGPSTHVTSLRARGLPETSDVEGLVDSTRDLGIGPRRDEERHVASPTGTKELLGAARTVRSRDHPARGPRSVVTRVVSFGDSLR